MVLIRRMLFVLLLPCFSFPAAYAEEEGDRTFQCHLDLGVGLAEIEDTGGGNNTFQRLSLLPRASAGRFSFGLDLTLDFDDDFALRDLDGNGKPDDWSEPSDLLYKVSSLRYGRPEDPLRMRVSAIQDYSLGHGFIMAGFTNRLFEPYIRQLGAVVEADGRGAGFPYADLRFVTEDVLDWDIIGVRTGFRPAARSTSPRLAAVTIGGTAVFDSDPEEDVLSEETGHPGDNPASNAVSVLGGDIEIPLMIGESAGLFLRADYAHISDAGSGFQTGLSYRAERVEFNGAIRFLGEEFTDHYFDPYYALDRSSKFDTLAGLRGAVGYDLGLALRFPRIARLSMRYEDVPEREDRRVVADVATLEKDGTKLSASVSYDRRNIAAFGDLFTLDDSLFVFALAYRVTGSVTIELAHRKTFQPAGESTDQTSVRTLFSLW
jgi:hypothetical protein